MAEGKNTDNVKRNKNNNNVPHEEEHEFDTVPGEEPRSDHEPGEGDVEQLLERLQHERDEFEQKYKRTLADYQNAMRRARESETEARRQGVTSVLHSVVPIIDNFDMALSQEAKDEVSKQILEGVKAIRLGLIGALETHGVSLINPEPNTEFDANRHEAIMHQPAEGVEPGHIVQVVQIGYALGDRVVRPAKVMVAPAQEKAEE